MMFTGEKSVATVLKYTARFQNEAFATQTETVTNIPALTHTHEWGEPTYDWSDDDSIVTAKRVCTNPSHIEREAAIVLRETEREASCKETGAYTLTAEFENEAFETQTKSVKERICKYDPSHRETEEVGIDPDAHDWGKWTVTKEATETEEGSETRICKYDPTHTETRPIPAGIAYRNVSGDGNIWYKGSKDTSDFAFKRSIDDASAIDHFAGIRVDDKAVDTANYAKESGSVIIKLSPEYLETLPRRKENE